MKSNINPKFKKQLVFREPLLSNTKFKATTNVVTMTKQVQGSCIAYPNGHTSIYERKHEADQLLVCGLY